MLSSGKKPFSLNPANSAIATGLSSQIKSLAQVNQGINLSKMALTTADGALASVGKDLQDLRDLALQAMNGGDSLDALNDQAQSLLANIDASSKNTNFNGNKLLDGSFQQSTNLDPNAKSSLNISLSSSSLKSLGLEGLDISTPEKAEAALEKIDEAIQKNLEARSGIGAKQSALQSATNTNLVAIENLSSAASQLTDVDYAKTISEFQLNAFKFQSQVALLNLQNQMFKSISQLLIGKLSGKS